MPKLSVWASRFALLYFAIGITIGALLLVNKAFPYGYRIWLLLPLHIEYLTNGWIVQLVFAVAFWIFPRFAGSSRGRVELAWLSLGFLNVGILIITLNAFVSYAWVNLAARLLEAFAVILLGIYFWFRVKPTETGKQITRSKA